MNSNKNKTLVTVVVLFVAFGLVMAYVPLFFTPSPSPAAVPAEVPATAQLSLPVAESEIATSTPTSTVEETPLPESFSGLEEENQSLEGLLEGL